METELNALGAGVWEGILNGGLIGPYLFNGTINSVSYINCKRSVGST